MYVYLHTRIHYILACMHTCIHAYIPTYLHIHRQGQRQRHTHTHLLRLVLSNFDVESICRAKTFQLHLTGGFGVEWKENSFVATLKNRIKINRSHEESHNISRKLQWTRSSPQSQIAPTVQKDKWRSHLHPFMCLVQILKWFSLKTAWWFLGLPHPITIQQLQVCLHSNLDGSSMAHAIQVPMGPLLKSESWKEATVEALLLFRSSTHTPCRSRVFLEDHKRWLPWCPMWVERLDPQTVTGK